MVTISVTNRIPPMPGGMVTQTVTSFSIPLVQAVQPETNGDVTCFPIGYIFPKSGRIVTNAYCVTNNPIPFATGMFLGWTQVVTNSMVFSAFSNQMLWSTNSPNGPWTGVIPILCTNSNMVIFVSFNPRVSRMFFRLGTNVW